MISVQRRHQQFLLALFAMCFSASCFATPLVEIKQVRAPATFALATTAAVYFSLTNKDSQPLLLQGVSVAQDIAEHATLHQTVIDNDMAKMRPIPLPLTIDTGQQIIFAPGGYHVMLEGLKHPLSVGQSFTVTFVFASGRQDVEVVVEKGNGHQHH